MINSSSLGDQSPPVVAAEASSTITESVADTVSRVVDGLRQSLGEGCSSSTSSDSLSSVVSAHITGIINNNSLSVLYVMPRQCRLWGGTML